MITHDALVFAAAIVVLLAAHTVRAIRHSLLFARDELPERFGLLLALSVSYALNAIVPFRLGEVVRAIFIAARLRVRVAYALATVVAERFADLVAVALISFGLAFASTRGSSVLLRPATMLAGAAVFIALGAILVQRTAFVRGVVWRVASVFNDAIRLSIVEFTWTAAGYVTEGRLLSRRFVVTTVGMWALYFAAYWLFAVAIGTSLSEVSLLLLGAPLRPLLSELFAGGVSRTSLALLLFTSVPVGVVILYGVIRQRREIQGSLRFVRRFGLVPAELSRFSLSRRFRNSSDYAALMQAHFTASRQIVSAFAGEGMDEVIVHRILPGGSEAVTAVIEVHGALSIRKVAATDAGRKLGVQVEWLRQHASALPLPDVLGEAWHGERFHYDMPFTLAARDFYDVIHTSPIESSKRILGDIVDVVDAFHSRGALGSATEEVVDAYLNRKVRENARDVLTFAKGLIDEDFTINGEAYRLADWACLLDVHWLREQVRSRDVSIIHGDLTVENIIVSPSHPMGWYLIDPNPSNTFDTPLIDWAKLRQSLNLGYEGLNRGGMPTLHGSAIRLPLTRSSAYADLDLHLRTLLSARCGVGQLREIAFHELVNYLRLIPYRIRQAPQRAIAFFACASILLRRYRSEGRA
jgi:hypothetical protein